ncbi:hypothetical protein D3C87_1220580 [compost metagenome]
MAVGFDGMCEQGVAVARDDQPVLRRAGAGVLGQIVQLHVEEARDGLADEIGRVAPVQPGGARQQLGAGMRHAQDAPGAVQRDGGFGVHVQELGGTGKAQHPFVAGARHQVGEFDAARGAVDQMQRQVLAGLEAGRTEQRDVEHGRQFAVGVVDGRGGAGQRRVGVVEVVGLVDGERFARFQAGAHRAGAGARLRPFRPQIEPGFAQLAGLQGVAQEFHGHALAVGQQQHVVLAGDLPEEMVQPAARDGDQGFGLLAVLAQPPVRHDVGLAGLGGVQPVLIQAAQPAAHHVRVALRWPA